MRPFRGKRVDNGEWVYGSLIVTHTKHCFIQVSQQWLDICIEDAVFEAVAVIPETVGQYIGLKDKNDKDLDWWEDDVFKMHGHSIPWAIVKEQGCFWFRCPVTKERKVCYKVAEYYNQPVKIGTIHDNPELIA